jgi:thioredoxin reductase (NADPH)
MAEYAPPIARTRREQMFFRLTAAEIERLRRFGTPRRFTDGEHLVRAGEVGVGMIIILTGDVVVTRRDGLGHDDLLTTYRASEFIAEVNQLAGRASFIDAHAKGAVEALCVSPANLRALLVAEAELGERIMRALILRRVGLIESGAGGPTLIGSLRHPGVLRLQNFLTRNGVPYRVLDPEVEHDADSLIASVTPSPEELPLVLCADGVLLRNPTEHELAERVGLAPRLDPNHRYDVAVVGGGPAGLATAVYAASEGLSVLVLEAQTYGGQAGASSRIENYLGFPTGITGQALVSRAFVQAQKFGAEVIIPVVVQELDCTSPEDFGLRLSVETTIRARTVVIASGARYRRPSFAGFEAAEQNGVHYWASPAEGKLCAGMEVALVGGGNSAGQAAVYLATKGAKVSMLVRGQSLEATMSSYLIERIAAQPNIALLTQTAIHRVDVDEAGALCRIVWRNGRTGVATDRALRHLFLFIGADPCVAWLRKCGVALDAKGFVLTGEEATTGSRPTLMTSRKGVFAIGDVRAGSTKRVAAAVGEGAAVVAQIHACLAQRMVVSAHPEGAIA